MPPLSVCSLLPDAAIDCPPNTQTDSAVEMVGQDAALWICLKLLREHKLEVLDILRREKGRKNQSINFLPPGAHLYGLPQTVYKLSPRFDTILIKLLVRDALGYVIIPAPLSKAWVSSILQRIRSRMVLRMMTEADIEGVLQRIVFIRNMNETEYLTLCAVFDVVLDPFPVGGGRSSLEIFSTGNVIVLQENETSVLHLTSGMYRAMGIDASSCCAATDVDDYVDKCYTLAIDSKFRDSLVLKIFERNNVLYENASVITEWERMLWKVSISARPTPQRHQGRPEKGTPSLCPTFGGQSESAHIDLCEDQESTSGSTRDVYDMGHTYYCEPIFLGDSFEVISAT